MPFPVMAALGLGMSALDSFLGANSAHQANRTNIRLQREQQAWEQQMANTAVQRRAADIERAGGNRALAFTGGQEAATPSVAPARVEPTYRGGGIQNAMAVANTAAQTRLTNAQAANLEFDLRWKIASDIVPLKRDILMIEKQLKEKQYDEVLPAQLRKIAQDIKTSAAQEAASAAQAEKIRRTIDEVEKQLQLQIRAQKLDVEALENIAKIGGIEANKASGIVRMLIDGVRLFITKGRR